MGDHAIVSFIYESFEGVHSERELAKLAANAQDLQTAFRIADPGGPVDLHGGVSMMQGEIELLGRECWTEDVRLLTLGTGTDRLNGLRFTLEVEPSIEAPDSVDVRLLDRDTERFRRTFDRTSYETSWQLMRVRAERVREALGDPEATRWLADWHRGWPTGGKHVRVDDSIRAWACETDLAELLAAGLPPDACP